MTDELDPQLEPFLADGISLGIPNTSATDIEQIDNAIFVDGDGNLHFRDNFTKNATDINGNPVDSLTLQDLYTRVKGVYVADGKLYFKDASVSRPYSLKELVGAYIDWKQKLTTGGLFWLGSTRITNSECNNIKVNVDGDPNLAANTPSVSGVARIYTIVGSDYPTDSSGTKVFSMDEYVNGLSDDFRLNTDGSWRWHDVPSLQILIPPVDAQKASVIIAKTNVRLVKSDKPIVFRLYDKTTEEELDRKAIQNDTPLSVEQQPMLTFVGTLPTFKDKLEILNCQCPTEDQEVAFKEEPPHVIAVQFHVDDQFTDASDNVFVMKCQNVSGDVFEDVDDTTNVRYDYRERRLIGIPNAISDVPIVNSSIDVIIFDTTKSDASGRKAGNKSFSNQDLIEVVFDVPFTSSEYSITLSCDKNINTWYTTKKSTGFIIRSEKKFTGTVDWIATKLKSQGDA